LRLINDYPENFSRGNPTKIDSGRGAGEFATHPVDKFNPSANRNDIYKSTLKEEFQ